MIAKIICHGQDRMEAIGRMKRALEECVVDGVSTTLEFHHAIVQDPKFIAGDLSTRFLERIDWWDAKK